MTQFQGDERETPEPLHEDDRADSPKRPALPEDGDLVVRDGNGDYFWIRKEEYKAMKIPHDAPEFQKMTDQMRTLTELGVVLADVPKGGLGPAGFACVLINLSGIRRPERP